jgi:hypothetical protein
MEGLISGRESMLEDNSGEPTKLYEAFNHPEPDVRVK